LKVKRLIVGTLGTNCYVVFDETFLEGVVIDPGAEGPKILETVKALGIKVRSILLTHGHFDHTGAAGFLERKTSAPVFIGEEDAALLKDPGWMGAFVDTSSRDFGNEVEDLRTLEEGDAVQFGEVLLRVLKTPGHSPGSLSFYAPGHLFPGDLIFRGSVGRTDLPGGDGDRLLTSITQKILTLPDETRIHPGHNGPTTVKREKEENPYIHPYSW